MNLFLTAFIFASSLTQAAGLVTIKVSSDVNKIGRFRYQIYRDEMSRPDQDNSYIEKYANHDEQTIVDPMDCTATNFIAENAEGELVGCIRLNYGRDGGLGDYPAFYDVDLSRVHLASICICTRFAVHPKYRSSLLPLQLTKHLYKHLLEDGTVKHSYMLAKKSLVPFYESLGCKAIGEKDHESYGTVTRFRFDLESDNVGPFSRIRRRVLSERKKKQQNANSGAALTPRILQLPRTRESSLVLGATVSTLNDNDTSGTHPSRPISDFRAAIDEAFKQAMAVFMGCKTLCLLAEGNLSLDQYKSILREIYFYVREDPQIELMATVYLRGRDRDSVKALAQHAISEMGHEQLALNDLSTLGADISEVPTLRPLPSTMGLISFAFYQVMFRNPIGHLGYLYFLEFLPTSAGGSLLSMLETNGVPKEATTFLVEHAIADVGHNKLMETHIVNLVRTEEDCHAVIHAIQTTAVLYTMMLDGAIENTSTSAHLPDGQELR